MYCSSCTNWVLWSGSWTLQATTASTTVATATASTRTTRECSSSGTGSSVGFQFKFRNFYSEVLQQCLNVVGTFEAERDDQEIAYGLVHPINNWNPLYTQVFNILSADPLHFSSYLTIRVYSYTYMYMYFIRDVSYHIDMLILCSSFTTPIYLVESKARRVLKTSSSLSSKDLVGLPENQDLETVRTSRM